MISKRPMTAEELLALPDDGQSYELVRGELRMMTPAGFEHGSVASNIHLLLGNHVKQHDLGRVLAAETGFRIGRNPDTVRAPDVAFVRRERIPPQDQLQGFAELAPDLVVEVVSPSDRSAEIEEKTRDYLLAGVKLTWIVYPETRSVTVYRSSTAIHRLTGQDEIDGADVLPGFCCKISSFFE